MDHHAVLTAIGADRPGLVDEVSAYVLERGGNLEDSRMVNLHGQFAMMLLVSGDEDAIDRLTGRSRGACRTGERDPRRPRGRPT